MDKQIIFEKIRTARLKRFLTNCYSMDVIEKADRLWEIGDNFIFSHSDHGITRLVFSVSSWNCLDELLDLVNTGTYYLEFMTKTPHEHIPNRSSFIARMLRLSNTDCRSVFAEDSPVLQYRANDIGELAKEEDSIEINRILWNVFHTEISHLLDDEEIREKINEGQITIYRESSQITALLQVEVLPKKFYINQIVNRSERRVIHAMLLNRLEQYIDAGGKYLYAWVDEKNIPSLKFHQKYGMEHDGNYSEIYRIERP